MLYASTSAPPGAALSLFLHCRLPINMQDQFSRHPVFGTPTLRICIVLLRFPVVKSYYAVEALEAIDHPILYWPDPPNTVA